MTDSDLRQSILKATYNAVDLANEKLNRSLEYPRVFFNIKGCCGGKAYWRKNEIRYNLGLARENFEDYIRQTVPHEVCHIVTNRFFNKRIVHGLEWKRFMREIYGLEPLIYHSYDVSNHRVRRTNTFSFRCSCGKEYRLGAVRRKRLIIGTSEYACRHCRTVLTYLHEVKEG